MLIRDRIKTGLILSALLLPVALAFYAGLDTQLGRADFVFVNQGEVSSLDPALATGIPEGRLIMAISEGLTSLHPGTLEPLPACAQSWEISGDGKTYTFQLRSGLTWSNAVPLTAHDFLRSWTRLLDPMTASSYAYLLWDVKGAKDFTESRAGPENLGLEAPDDCTFIVRLERICPYFEILAAFYPLFPVEGNTDSWLDPASIVTNGPFRMEARLLKDRIRLKKNPHYWDADRVKIETIDALAVTSSMTALNLYLTGDVDWINNVPPVVLPFVRDREDFTLSPNLGTNFLRLNTTVSPLNDVKVRKAIHLAVDKASLTRYVLKGGQHPATSFVPPGIPGYAPPVVKGYDPEAARRLLAEAGFPGGEGFPELNLLYIANETSRDIAEVITLQLRTNLKVTIHPTAQERKGYFVSQNSLDYDLCLCSWLGDYLDASTFLDVFRSNSGNNRTGWKNSDYDALMERAAGEMDRSRRADVMAEAERLLLTELPLAPLYFRTTANMIKNGWTGYHDNIQDVHPLKYMERRPR